MAPLRSSVLPVLIVSALAVAGCEDDKPAPKPASSASADPHVGAYRDRNVEKAMAAAGAASASAAAATNDGPPPGGIFPLGAADKKHAPDAPAVVTLISAGSSPQITLKGGLAPEDKAKLKLLVLKRLQRPLPPLAYAFTASSKAASDAPGAGRMMQFELKKVAPAQGGLPADVVKQLDALSGSQMNFKLGADNSLSFVNLGIKKAGDSPVAQQLLDGAREATELLFVPVPAKPVGVGATWMTEDRGSMSGMKVVRYRLTKIEKIDGDTVTFSVTIRQYLVDQTQIPPVDQKNIVAGGFQSQGNGIIVRHKDKLIPDYAEVKLPSVVQLVAQDKPTQAIPLQVEIAVRLGQPPTAPGAGSAAPSAKPAPAPK